MMAYIFPIVYLTLVSLFSDNVIHDTNYILMVLCIRKNNPLSFRTRLVLLKTDDDIFQQLLPV